MADTSGNDRERSRNERERGGHKTRREQWRRGSYDNHPSMLIETRRNDPADVVVEHESEREVREVVRQALRDYPRMLEAAELVWFDCMMPSEAAKVLGVTRQVVERRLERAKVRLKN